MFRWCLETVSHAGGLGLRGHRKKAMREKFENEEEFVFNFVVSIVLWGILLTGDYLMS